MSSVFYILFYNNKTARAKFLMRRKFLITGQQYFFKDNNFIVTKINAIKQTVVT